MIRRSIHIFLIAFAVLSLANFAVASEVITKMQADDLFYCIGESDDYGKTTALLTISPKNETLHLEATYQDVTVISDDGTSDKTEAFELPLEAENNSNFEFSKDRKLLIAEERFYKYRAKYLIFDFKKRTITFNLDTLELKYYQTSLNAGGIMTSVISEYRCIKSK